MGTACSRSSRSYLLAFLAPMALLLGLVIRVQAQEPNTAPVAMDGTLTVAVNTTAFGTLTATDLEGNTLTYSLVAGAAHGTVTLTNATTGAFTYTPATDYAGADSFTFRASDGLAESNIATVAISVLARVATPTFSPVAGAYANPASITLACATPGATIHYTTDGSAPTATSPVYTAPILLSSSSTVKAVAAKEGMFTSTVASAGYNLGDPYEPDGTAGTAKTIAPGETQQRSIHVVGDTDWVQFTLTETSAVTIRMTIPVATASVMYLYGPDNPTLQKAYSPSNTSWVAQIVFPSTNPLTPGTYYIKLLEYSNKYTIDSYTLTLSVTPTIALPTFSPTPGNSANPTTVTISCATPGVTIHYTTDGSTPTVNSPVYAEPFTLTATTTVKALAVKAGLPNSGIASGTYVMPDSYEPDNTAAAAKIITPGETQQRSIHVVGDTDWVQFTLTETSAVTIRMTIPVATASVMYLYGPDNPTLQKAYSPSNTSWVAQIVFPSTNPLTPGTYYIKLLEYSNKYTIDSYTLTLSATPLTIALPTLSPTPGLSPNPTTVAIACATPGATIHYTTDGSDPTTDSPVYAEPFTLTASATVKALAVKTGLPNSGIVSGTYLLPDSYESDDDPASAKEIAAGETQQRSRHLATDVDWLTFTLAEKSAVTISVSGPGATNAVTLYGPNDATTVIDGCGDIAPLQIVRPATDPLAPGTYYLSVKPFSDAFPAAVPMYTISLAVVPAVATPVFTPAPGAQDGQTIIPVGISSSTPGAAIHYTTDGSAPTSSSPVYTDPLQITSTTTVRAIAIKEGMPNSEIAAGTYTIQQQRPTVSITSPADGAVIELKSGPITVTVAAEGTGAAITQVALYAQADTEEAICIGVEDEAPYIFVWEDPFRTTVTLTAIATDAQGVETTSDPVTIQVNKAPKVKPPHPDNPNKK